MTAPCYDVAIIGAGLAGLSLAVRLAEPRLAGLRVLVVEPRATYHRDRTWSSWALRPHPFEEAVASRWDRWAVAVDGRPTTCAAPGLTYESIPADALYRLALGRLRAAPNIDLRLGVATDATEDRDGVELRLDPGGTIRVPLAFDTRPTPALGRHGLMQVFLGQEIETERCVFDPGTAVLMDFRGPSAGATHFTYVLPSTTRRALVEDTWFTPAGFQTPDHRLAIRRYMAERYGVDRYAVHFEERGALPMDPVFQPRRGTRLLALGSAGGATRPSTGYAFNAVQAQAERAVAALAQGRLPTAGRPRSSLVRFMDRVLLSLLARRPDQAPHIFAALFEGCAPGALVRFLNDAAGPADIAAVAAAIPFLPTTGEAVRLMAGRVAWPRPATAG